MITLIILLGFSLTAGFFSPSEGILLGSLGTMFFLFVGILKNWYHFIMMLMMLEAAMILIFLILSQLGALGGSINLIFIFSTFMVVGACLSMANLTMVSRSHGNDYMLAF